MTVTLSILGGILIIVGWFYFKVRKLKNMPEEPAHESILNLTTNNYNRIIKSGIILVDFWASWCMPCKMMAPVLNQVATEVNGKATVAKVDVQQFQDLASKNSVRNIPTLILFKDGKEVERFVGVKTKDVLLKAIKNID